MCLLDFMMHDDNLEMRRRRSEFDQMSLDDKRPRRYPPVPVEQRPRADVEGTWAALAYVLNLTYHTFLCNNLVPQRTQEKWVSLAKKISLKSSKEPETRSVGSNCIYHLC